eukprot:g4279.t1
MVHMMILLLLPLLLFEPSRGEAKRLAVDTPPSWSEEFEANQIDPTKWTTSSHLGGFNGEFHFYTGDASNRSNNIVVKEGKLFIRPDLTANYKPDGLRPLGWDAVLGCGSDNPRDVKGRKKNDACLCKKNKNGTYCHEVRAVRCTEGNVESSMCYARSGECVRSSSSSSSSACDAFTVIPPVTSALLRTNRSFAFGRVEIRAKIPKGDWLWPAIWMLSETDDFGPWPRSGEIDIMESRGNEANACGPLQGRNGFGSTVHFGPDAQHNGFLHAHTEGGRWKGTGRRGDLSDDFHVYGMEWNRDGLFTYVDKPEHKILVLDFKRENFWSRGSRWETQCLTRTMNGTCTAYAPRMPAWTKSEEKSGVVENPYTSEGGTRNVSNATPFDRPFYIQLNLAVGGLGGFFHDRPLCPNKPWSNTEAYPLGSFVSAFDQWWPTWGGSLDDTASGPGDDASFVVDWVRYWENQGT